METAPLQAGAFTDPKHQIHILHAHVHAALAAAVQEAKDQAGVVTAGR